jgi:hypothetical protein
MLTDRQLKTLMEWVYFAARYQAKLELSMEGRPDYQATEDHALKTKAVRKGMYDAFGFVEDAEGWPVVPTHPQTLPPAKPGAVLATSDPEGHRQAIADADYDAKHAAIYKVLNRGIPAYSIADTAHHLMTLWLELKAIMEPDTDMHASRDASLIESLVRRYGGIPDYALERMAAGESLAGYSNPGPQTALAVLAARARLKA